MRLHTLPTALAVGVAFAHQAQAARQVFAHYMVSADALSGIAC